MKSYEKYADINAPEFIHNNKDLTPIEKQLEQAHDKGVIHGVLGTLVVLGSIILFYLIDML